MAEGLKKWGVLGTATILYLIYAAFLYQQAPLAEFYDTDDYVRISQYPVSSPSFWMDRKPAAGPLLYKIFNSDLSRIAFFQWVLATFSWFTFAATLMLLVNHRVLKPLIFVSFLLMSLSPQIFIWHKLLLSESPATSLFVLVLSAWILLLGKMRCQTLTSPGKAALIVGFLALAVLWSFFRDIHLYFMLGAGVCAIMCQLFFRTRLPLIPLGLGFLAIFAVQNHFSHGSGRWTDPLAHVLTKRILPNPTATQWFANHGMPQGPEIMELAGRFANPQEQARFEPWLTDRGKGVYARYLISHPVNSISAPVLHLEQLFDRDLSTYAKWQMPAIQRLPGILFFSPILIWFITFCILIGVVWFRRKYLDIIWHIPIILLFLTAPLIFISWHGDTMEIARHAFGANLQARLALFFGLFLATDRLIFNQSTRSPIREK